MEFVRLEYDNKKMTNMEQKMIIVDSLDHLPENPYKTITMDFEKSYAVKWYAILVYADEELVGFMHVFRHLICPKRIA